MTMHVSYGELIRTMPEAIRMLGFTYSQADDSAESIIWTECVLGEGYELLRDADPSVAGAPVQTVKCNGEGVGTVLSLGNRPAFAFAARIADLATVKAASDEASIIRVHGATGPAVAPFIAFRIARSGYGALVLWNPGPRHNTDDRRPMLIVAPPAGATIGILRDCSFLTSPLRNDLPFACARSISQAWYERATAPHPEDEILVLAARMADRSAGELDDLLAKAQSTFGPVEAIDVSERLERAIAEGLEVPPERHRILTRLTSRIRIPSSERSRAQAG